MILIECSCGCKCFTKDKTLNRLHKGYVCQGCSKAISFDPAILSLDMFSTAKELGFSIYVLPDDTSLKVSF